MVKNLVVKNHSNGEKVIRLTKSVEGPVLASDIEKDADIEVMNPELVICNLVVDLLYVAIDPRIKLESNEG